MMNIPYINFQWYKGSQLVSVHLPSYLCIIYICIPLINTTQIFFFFFCIWVIVLHYCLCFCSDNLDSNNALENSLIAKEKLISELNMELHNIETTLSNEREEHINDVKKFTAMLNEKVKFLFPKHFWRLNSSNISIHYIKSRLFIFLYLFRSDHSLKMNVIISYQKNIQINSFC